MTIADKILQLREKDTSVAFENLKDLEKLSEQNDSLYDYFDQFLEMIESDQYVIRTRGFRLLCKQAKWDKEKKIEHMIGVILANLDDEKPTAVRQKLLAVQGIVKYLPQLNDEVKKAVKGLDYSRFKDTMRPLIEKDAEEVLKLIDG